MMKMTEDNDVNDRNGPNYLANETELSWTIWKGMVFYEVQIGQ